MDNITAARDISSVATIGIFKGISPVCVPCDTQAPFSDDVMHRANPRIVSLWDRLGLVYFMEQAEVEPAEKSNVVVNNFTAEFFFKLYSQNYVDRLIERYRPRFVLSDNFKAAASNHNKDIAAAEKKLAMNRQYTEEISRVFRLVFEKTTSGIPMKTLVNTLSEIVKTVDGKSSPLLKHEEIYKRIVQVATAEFPEMQLTKEIASAGSLNGLSAEQKKYVLSIGGNAGSHLEKQAVRRVVSLSDSGKSRDEIGKVLIYDVSEYGLADRTAANDVTGFHSFTKSDSQEYNAVLETGVPKAFVLPTSGTIGKLASLIYSDEKNNYSADNSVGEQVTSDTISRSSAVKLITDRITDAAWKSAPLSNIISDVLIKKILSKDIEYIKENPQSTDKQFDTIKRNAAVMPITNSGRKAFNGITTGASLEILNSFSYIENNQLISANTEDSKAFSDTVEKTVEIMRQYSKLNTEHPDKTPIDNTAAEQYDFSGDQGFEYADIHSLQNANVADASHNLEATTPLYRNDAADARSGVLQHIYENNEVGEIAENGAAAQNAETAGSAKTGTVLRNEQYPTAERTLAQRTAENSEIGASTPVGTVTSAVGQRQKSVSDVKYTNSGDVVFSPKNEKVGFAQSYRSRLDSATLEYLDKMVADAKTHNPISVIGSEEPELVHNVNISSEHNEDRINVQNEEIRNISTISTDVVTKTTSHIRKLIEKAVEISHPVTVQNKGFTMRQIKSQDMVMLVPPAEEDRFAAANRTYSDKSVSMELKQPVQSQPQKTKSEKSTVKNSTVVRKTVDGGLSSFSREDINRLADKVYDCIEDKLNKERRRMGL